MKENCPDIRNSKVIDVINELKDFGAEISVYDPWADAKEVQQAYNISLIQKSGFQGELNGAQERGSLGGSLKKYKAVVLAVAHDEFKAINITPNKQQVIYDIKSVLKLADESL